VGADVGAIGFCSLLGFGSGRQYAFGLLILIFEADIFIHHQFPAEGMLLPHHRQYLFVVCNPSDRF